MFDLALPKDQSWERELLLQHNWMHPIRWVPDSAHSLLDVGCNVGDFLLHCRELHPTMRLAGIEVNNKALQIARTRLPNAELHVTSATALPFANESFDCVTCIEVLEHIPARLRVRTLTEIQRVLRRGGRLILRLPHAGLFDWLDAANFRLRVPWLFRLLKLGRPDVDASDDIVWHHHFTEEEVIALLGEGWECEDQRRGGLFLLPLVDMLCWPFYRTRSTENFVYRMLNQIKAFDLGVDYGNHSFDLLLVLKKVG